MNLKFRNKAITGVLSVVPRHRVNFLEEMDNYGFSREKCLNLKETMGFDQRRLVEGNECASDLCLFGLEYLLAKGWLHKEEIGALILVTQTPDHLLPPTSSVLHGKLGLSREVFCLDINQGCTGYLYGLMQAFMLLDQVPDLGKAVLLNGDTLSRCSCPHDRNIYPMIGDAGAVTIVENRADDRELVMNLKMDGTRYDALIVPAGAFRYPSTEETRAVKTWPDGNRRSQEHFFMKGSVVFLFTQTDVAAGIQELFETTGRSLDEIDYFMFHQPNRFMLHKLAHKLGVPLEKMPSNIVETFGNSSSATIPVNMCHNLREVLLEKRVKLCLSGFGVGLSWGALIMDVGPLEFCELIEK